MTVFHDAFEIFRSTQNDGLVVFEKIGAIRVKHDDSAKNSGTHHTFLISSSDKSSSLRMRKNTCAVVTTSSSQ